MDNTQNVPVNVTPSVAKAPEPTFDNGPSIVGKKDKKTAWILAIVLLLIIAAGGVGFGVWAYMDGNTQREQLNAQISSLTQQNSELQEKIEDLSKKKGDEDTSVEISYDEIDVWSDGSKNIESAFLGKTSQIDIKDWGFSLIIPETLDNISYSVRHFDGDGQDGYDALRVSGTINGVSQVPDFANMNLNSDGLVGINRLKKGQADDKCVLLFSDDDYDYCFVKTLGVYSTDEDMMDLESQSANLIQQVVLNPENYSKM